MTSLYHRILGADYTSLPPSIQELHNVSDIAHYTGSCSVERGTHPANRILANLLILPKTQKDVPLTVTFTVSGLKEKWTRHFGKDRFTTIQYEQGGLLYERLSFVTLVFEVSANTQQLRLNLKKILFLGMPIHWLFRPKVEAIEYEKDGIFHLTINVVMPLTGLLVRYNGWLQKIDEAAR